MGCFECIVYRVWHACIQYNHIRIGFFLNVNVNVRNICWKGGEKNAVSISLHFMWTFLHLTDLCSECTAVSQSYLISRSVRSCHVSPCFTALDQLEQEGTFSECLLGLKFGRSEWLNLHTHKLLSLPSIPGSGPLSGWARAETVPTVAD